MKKTLKTAALALALFAAACDGAGDHNDADETSEGSAKAGSTLGDSLAKGAAAPVEVPPPQGTVYPAPGDSNPSPTTPANSTSEQGPAGSAAGVPPASGPSTESAGGASRP